MRITMGQNRPARQEPRKSRFPTSKSPAPRPWLIILNPLGLSNEGDFSHYPVSHAISCSGSRHPLARRSDGCIGGNPHFHHRQPGRRLWGRPMPRQRRTLRRLGRTLLLPITGFCAGFDLSPRRSRRNYRRRAERRRPLPARQLRRLRRNHLPTLKATFPPYRRRGNDVTLPPEGAMGSNRGC